MFKSLLAACAALTIALNVAVSVMSSTSNRAYADTLAPQTLVIEAPQTLEVAIVEYTPSFSDADLQCMTENIYFEARNQSVEGQYAVAEVVLNRLASDEFPNSVCGVVKQKSSRNCQFSWYCDGLSDKMRDKDAEARARLIARTAFSLKTNFTQGAKYYHANYVSPRWSKSGKIKQIQDHIFYSHI
jgi:spore germination cell wall hydrolase CwlJ-like protein